MAKNVFLYGMNENHKTVIIVAGGSGSRMQSEKPKQFIEIAGKPIVFRTIDAFLAFDKNILLILVLPSQFIKEWSEKLANIEAYKNIKIIAGGSTRTASVREGLALCPAEGIVGIHDAARPFVSKTLIEKCFRIASQKGSCIPCIACVDSVRQVDTENLQGQLLEDLNSKNILRDSLFLVQTPQCFDAKKLKELYAKTDTNFSDDASLWETNGEKIHLTLGETENIKITTQIDIHVANALMTTH